MHDWVYFSAPEGVPGVAVGIPPAAAAVGVFKLLVFKYPKSQQKAPQPEGLGSFFALVGVAYLGFILIN